MKHKMMLRGLSAAAALLLAAAALPEDALADFPVYDSKADLEAEVAAIPTAWPVAPDINSPSAIVVEVNTGTILYAKNCDNQMYPASTTKIMTALLAIERCNLEDTITYSETAIGSLTAGASNIAISVGEELSVEDSLYGLLLPSANECANALAEQTSGSISAFVNLMNQTAEEFGCLDTHFVNPNGLHDDDHYSCAYDLALIMSRCVENSTFVTIDSAASYTIQPTNKQSEVRSIRTTDEMKRSYSQYFDSRVLCAKTGWTEMSGRNLVTYAEDGGMDVVVVVLGTETPYQYEDTEALLEYAFSSFSIVNPEDRTITEEGAVNTPLGLIGDSSLYTLGSDGAVLLPTGISFDDLTTTYEKDGTEYRVNYSVDGYQVGTAKLIQCSLVNGTATLNQDLVGHSAKGLVTVRLIWIVAFAALVVLITVGTIVFLKATKNIREHAKYEKKRAKQRKKEQERLQDLPHGM